VHREVGPDIAPGKELEKAREICQLIIRKSLGEEVADVSDMRRCGIAQPLTTGIGEPGIHNAPIIRGSRALDHTGSIQTIKHASNASLGEQDGLREIDRPHAYIGCPRQEQQHLVLAQSEPVRGA
jgi:hypothetical protein